MPKPPIQLAPSALETSSRCHLTNYSIILSLPTVWDMHVEDHEAFVARTASLLRVGGTFLLMTQNPFVWNHSSELTQKGEGQIRNWPPLSVLRQLLKKDFCISEVHGIMPMGDKGIMRIIQSQPSRILVRLLVGKSVRNKLYDRYTGRELIVVARRCQ